MTTRKLTYAMAAVIAVTLTACKHGDTTTEKGVDTAVVTTQIRDTTVVKADTTIHVDTVKQTHNAPDQKKP